VHSPIRTKTNKTKIIKFLGNVFLIVNIKINTSLMNEKMKRTKKERNKLFRSVIIAAKSDTGLSETKQLTDCRPQLVAPTGLLFKKIKKHCNYVQRGNGSFNMYYNNKNLNVTVEEKFNDLFFLVLNKLFSIFAT
jgi:cellobiose-specific phosphotransferase system component IIB